MPLFTDKIRITRRVTVEDDGVATVTPVVDPALFDAELTPPRLRSSPPRPGSPQSIGVFTLRYWKSPVSFYAASLQAGDRFEAKGNEWEVLKDAEDILVGMRAGIQMTQALPLTILYPFQAKLEEMNEVEVDPDVRVAIWEPAETHQDTGTYHNYRGQVPIEFRNQVRNNRVLSIGDQKFKITTSEFDLVDRRVYVDLRKAGRV